MPYGFVIDKDFQSLEPSFNDFENLSASECGITLELTAPATHIPDCSGQITCITMTQLRRFQTAAMSTGSSDCGNYNRRGL